MTKAQRVIERIGAYQGRAFAIWEIVQDCGVSSSYVRRVLGVLRRLRLVRKLSTGLHWRVWCAGKSWPPDSAIAFEQFDIVYRFTRAEKAVKAKNVRR